MNRFRIFLMLAILLATATAVHAQEPRYAPPPVSVTEAQPESGCPAANWYFQAYQDGAAALQRLRVMCAAGQTDGCCEGKLTAGAVKGCEVAQAPKACCCAKACACCETCKAKKDATVASGWNPFAPVRVLPQPIVAAQYMLPPQAGSGIVQIMPVQTAQVFQVALTRSASPVHFATPDLDAHCERMHHRGDVIVLEGNVLLLVKKHAQPVRIEAQRVLVNMRDGSFTVESNGPPVTPAHFGVMRTSAGEMPNMRLQIQMASPVQVIPVLPASSATERLLPPPPLRDNSIPR